MIVFVTGGARSGKSSYALKRVSEMSSNPVYIATAKVWDKEFEQRVNRHKAERGDEWTNYEVYKDLASLPLTGRTVIIDCVTLWLTSLFVDHKSNIDLCLEIFKKEIEALAQMDAAFFIITNEIGMGVHAETEIGRRFTDMQGWANQFVASKADEVIFMVSGISMKIK